MDQGSEELSGAPISPGPGGVSRRLDEVSLRLNILSMATAPAGPGTLDIAPELKDRKSIKLMAKQDCLALLAAAQAVRGAHLTAPELRSQTGIYLTVGILPFEEQHLHVLAENSTTAGRFDMKRFSTDGLSSTNPILTFKCLPNMPLFHISYNLGIQGPYFVTYPGPSQFFGALECALADLKSEKVRFALVGAVADQENFLVRHHVRRAGFRDPQRLRDVACMMIVTLDPSRPGRAKMTAFKSSYSPVDPFSSEFLPGPSHALDFEAGPAEPLLVMKNALDSDTRNLSFRYEDGVTAELSLEAVR